MLIDPIYYSYETFENCMEYRKYHTLKHAWHVNDFVNELINFLKQEANFTPGFINISQYETDKQNLEAKIKDVDKNT